ncbi:TIGR01841 family phasin [Undibacterium arcticum]|uniref:TIGR01841 family phasin n=1 Tax=Undibacterium arcticum TaxID=1762892 RepID=A0ABV7F656_9BURK
MFFIPEQFSALIKANVDAHLASTTALTNKAFESVQKMVDLNMSAAKASFAESTVAAKELLSAKDLQEWFLLTAGHVQPNIEKTLTLAYGRHVASIASSAQADFTKAAEAQIAESNRKLTVLIDEMTKNAPAGSENAIALVKSAIGNANAGYEQLAKTTHQVVDALDNHLTTAANQFSQAVEKTTRRATNK